MKGGRSEEKEGGRYVPICRRESASPDTTGR